MLIFWIRHFCTTGRWVFDLFPGRAKSSDILVILTLLYSLETYLKKRLIRSRHIVLCQTWVCSVESNVRVSRQWNAKQLLRASTQAKCHFACGSALIFETHERMFQSVRITRTCVFAGAAAFLRIRTANTAGRVDQEALFLSNLVEFVSQYLPSKEAYYS